MPRQIFAAISDQRAGQAVIDEVDVGLAQAELDEQPGDDRELRVVDPPEGDRRQHRRHDPRYRIDGAQQRLERRLLFSSSASHRPRPNLPTVATAVEDTEEDGVPEDRILEQVLEISHPT